VLLSVIGRDLPGRSFCGPDGETLGNVHVGVQVGSEPEQLVRADADEARWELTIRTTIDRDGELDFRGPGVHGARGDRFVYLTWGDLDTSGAFHMFRRAKLMLHRVEPDVMRRAVERDRLRATVHLTDGTGAPRCARVDPPAVAWEAG
jgi:hypothetical protein